MNDVLHSTLCKTPSIFNLSSSTTNCSFPSTLLGYSRLLVEIAKSSAPLQLSQERNEVVCVQTQQNAYHLPILPTRQHCPPTCTLKIWQDDRYGPHLPWTRIRASVERSKTASGISSMLPTHTRRLLQINTWGPSSSFVFRGPIMAKIDPASALAASRSSTSDQSVRELVPVPIMTLPLSCAIGERISPP